MATMKLLPKTTHKEGDESDGMGVKQLDHIRINIIEDPRVSDTVFKHIAEMFTTRELCQLNCVSEAWKMLVLDNMLGTSESPHTKDWYFPLRFKLECISPRRHRPHAHKWIWSGVHHSSRDMHTLPDIPNRMAPEEPSHSSLAGTCHSSVYHVLFASSGGLLLLVDKRRTVEFEKLSFVVYNPLTQASRVLPTVKIYHIFHLAHMVVDENAFSYKVILIFHTYVCVYTSSSNSWRSSRGFIVSVPWQLDIPARAVVGGKLHSANLEIDGEIMNDSEHMQERGHVRVIEVDDAAGRWKRIIRFPLRDHFPTGFEGFKEGSIAIALVECMGRLFVLIPANLDVHMTVEKEILQADKVVEQADMQTYKDYGYLSLQFFVVPLHGGDVVGQLRMRLSNTRNASWFKERSEQASGFLVGDNCFKRWLYWLKYESSTWLQCRSRGSSIWVTFADYLLQYDMVSIQSQTFILANSSSGERYEPDFEHCEPYLDYTPSFHLKP